MHRVRPAARENASRGWSRSLAPDIEPGRFFEGVDVNRRTTAFVLGAILPFLLLPFAATSVTDPRVLVAAGLTPILIALVLELPWARLPAWTQAVPLLAYFVVVGLLRDASEGSSSIFDPLVALVIQKLLGFHRFTSIVVIGRSAATKQSSYGFWIASRSLS